MSEDYGYCSYSYWLVSHKPEAGASDTFKPQQSYVNRLWREFEPLNDFANQGWLQNTSLLKDTSVLFKLRENCHAR